MGQADHGYADQHPRSGREPRLNPPDPADLTVVLVGAEQSIRLAQKVKRRLHTKGHVVVGGRAAEAGDRPAALWRVGIEDLRDRSRIAEVVELCQT